MKIISLLLAIAGLFLLGFANWSTRMVTGMADLAQAQANLEIAQTMQTQAKVLMVSQCLNGLLITAILGILFLLGLWIVVGYLKRSDYAQTQKQQGALFPARRTNSELPSVIFPPIRQEEPDDPALFLLEHWS